eukprot:scaffold1183_cov418-Prasinococcus_capsulatus_cf.AAC.15
MTVKEPGYGVRITQQELELLYDAKYSSHTIPEAYERLMLDCINGDQQHFVRRDELKYASAWPCTSGSCGLTGLLWPASSFQSGVDNLHSPLALHRCRRHPSGAV